jgi:hypothetical protein
MLSGTEHGISKANIVLGAAKDLDFSLAMKRERMRAGVGKGFEIFGVIETIYIEPDRDCRLDPHGERKTGRRLYWPENGPMLAKTIPEQDLIFAGWLPTRNGWVVMPDVPDPEDVIKNPYGGNHRGQTTRDIPLEARKKPQRLGRIASAKFRNFLIFHPIAQIIFITTGKGSRFGSIGSAKLPLSSLTGFDGRKMALMIDPYTGEAYFTGGRYDFSDRVELIGEASAPQTAMARA